MNRHNIFQVSVVAALMGACPLVRAEVEVSAADIMGPDGIVYPDFSRAGVPGGIPDTEVVINVIDLGAIPNDDKDDAAIIQAAVLLAKAKGGGAVLIPEGDYMIDQTIVIDEDNTVIRGADRQKTRLIPRFAGSKADNPRKTEFVFQFVPKKVNRRYDVYPDQPIRRGDTTVHLAEERADRVQVGDMVILTAMPPADIIPTLDPRLQKQATDGSYGSIYSFQYLKVKAVEGTTVTFDRPIRHDLAVDQKPKIMHVPALLTNSGVENLTIDQTDVDKQGISGVLLKNTYGCWLKDVTILKIGSWPLSVDRSWHFEIRDTKFDESQSRGGAVAYLGFTFSCDGLIDNMRATRLRHLSISSASNGLVFKDCFLENIDINFHLNWPYEVLFENGVVDSGLGADPAPDETLRGSGRFGVYTPRLTGDMHVPAGPRLTFYHNRITSDWDALMIGGGGTQNTLVAYNLFDARNSFAAVLRRGSEGTVIHENVFVLRSPETRRDWMTEETYARDDAASLQGLVYFPEGVPGDVTMTGNRFYTPSDLPMYIGGTPEINDSNETIVLETADSRASSQVALSGKWRLKAVQLLPAPESAGARSEDPGISDDARKLLAADGADGDWSTVTLPGMLNGKAADFGKQDGEVVLRRNFDLPAALVGKSLTLSLGAIDDHDETWVNGQKVGAMSGKTVWKEPRLYTVPADLLKAKGNVIAIRVWDAFGDGGFSGTASEMWVGMASENATAAKLPAGAQMPEPPVPSLFEWQRRQRAGE